MVSEQRKATMAAYAAKTKAYQRFQEATARDIIRLEMVAAYGGKCVHCGLVDAIVMVLDHINDDPGPEYEECGTSARGGYWLYKRLKEHGWPQDRFQLLCCNCNMRKEYNRRRQLMVDTYGEPPPRNAPISRGQARAKSKIDSRNTTGLKGVQWRKNRNRWLARTLVDGKIIGFGQYESIRDAYEAYKKGMIGLYGDDAVFASDEEVEALALQYEGSWSTELTAEELGL